MPMHEQGWFGLQRAMPLDSTNIISRAQLDVTNAIFKNSSTFATPAAGSWTSPACTFQDAVSLTYTNATSRADLAMIANSINTQSKMSNVTLAPLPIQDLFFLYGNDKGRTDWQMNIPINFDANYSVFELGILENLGTRGDQQGTFPVLDFGSPTAGVKILKLIFSGYFWPLEFGNTC